MQRDRTADVVSGVVGIDADSPWPGSFLVFRLRSELERHMQKRCASKPYQFQKLAVQSHSHLSTSTKWHVWHRDQRNCKLLNPCILATACVRPCMLVSCYSRYRAVRKFCRRCLPVAPPWYLYICAYCVAVTLFGQASCAVTCAFGGAHHN